MAKKKKDENIEEEGTPLCPECSSGLVEEDGDMVCPKCDGEIDFFGDDE